MVCKPEADIILTVQADGDTDPQDTKHFRVSDLYFQEVDKDSGEDIYTASVEEYSHLYCENCSGKSPWTRCVTCTVETALTAKKKTSKVSTRRKKS